jgi:hypothetical protein
MEIEMIEPVLYLRYFPGSAKKVAKMISEEFLKPTASPTKTKGREIPAFFVEPCLLRLPQLMKNGFEDSL